MKKNLVFLAILIISIISVTIFFPKNHSINYIIETEETYKIKEEYSEKDNNKYTHTIVYKTKTFEVMNHFKLKEEKIIKSIKKIEEKEYTCLEINYVNNKEETICEKNKELFLKNYLFKNITNESKEIETIQDGKYKIFNKETNLFVSTFKGILNISKEITEINLFKKEIYEVELIYQLNNHIIIADYNSEYRFEKFILINLKTKKKTFIKTPKGFSFNSYFQGIYNNELYFYELSTNEQYKINTKNQTVKRIEKGNVKILTKEGFRKTTTKITEQNKMVFHEDDNEIETEDYHYKVEIKKEQTKIYRYTIGKELIKTNILNEKHIKIIGIYNESIYYLKEDTIYRLTKQGLEKVMTSDEFMYNSNIFLAIYEEDYEN